MEFRECTTNKNRHNATITNKRQPVTRGHLTAMTTRTRETPGHHTAMTNKNNWPVTRGHHTAVTSNNDRLQHVVTT
jgi:hypothetical protein